MAGQALRCWCALQLWLAVAVYGFATSPDGRPPREYYCSQVANPRLNLYWSTERRRFHANATTYVASSLGDGAYVALPAQGAYKPRGTLVATTVGIILHDEGVAVVDTTFNYFGACQILELIDIIDPPVKTITHVLLTNYHTDHRFASAVYYNEEVQYIMSDFTYSQNTNLAVNQFELFFAQQVFGFADFATDELGFGTAVFSAIYDPAILTDSTQVPSSGNVVTPVYSLTVGGRQIDALNFGPLQSPGDLLIHDRASNVMYMGNMIPNSGTFQPIDSGSNPSDNIESYNKLETYLTQHRPAVCPGHGYPMNADEAIEFVRAFSGYLSSVMGLVQEYITEAGGAANATLQGACDAVPTSKALELNPYFEGPDSFHTVNVQTIFFSTAGYDPNLGDSTGAQFCQFPSFDERSDPRRLTWADIGR